MKQQVNKDVQEDKNIEEAFKKWWGIQTIADPRDGFLAGYKAAQQESINMALDSVSKTINLSFDTAQQKSEDEAVEFAEWIVDNFWIMNQFKKWVNSRWSGSETALSTKKLYQLWKKEK